MSDSALLSHALANEVALLSAVAQSRHAAIEVAERVAPTAFQNAAHRRVYEAIVGLVTDEQPIDSIAILSRLSENGHLDEVGGHNAVMQVCGEPVSSHQWEFYARRVLDVSRRIEVARAGQRLLTLAHDLAVPVDDTVMDATRWLEGLPGLDEDRLRVYSDAELGDLPEVEWLVDQHITTGLTFLYGPSGHGKTFVMLDMSLCIAAGIPWHGQQTLRGPVLYVAAEGRSGLSRRRDAWKEQYPKADTSMFHVIAEPLNLQHGADIAALSRRIREVGPVLVVIDTLARTSGDADENKKADMQPIVDALDRLRARYECAVIVVHHAGVDTRRERGSTAMRGAADTMVKVFKRSGEANIVNVWCDKQKDGEEFPAKAFTLLRRGGSVVLSHVTDDGRRVASPKTPDELRTAWRQALQGREPMTRAKLLRMAPFSPEILDEVLGSESVQETLDDKGRTVYSIPTTPV